MEKTLGGERLGSGNKMKVHLHHYERSTHDLSKVIRTTMSPGTLVPFVKYVALPGDTFDLDINADVMTSPTLGPLFGSMKLQIDFFLAPIRLYQGQLQSNQIGIGMNMSQIKLPLIEVVARNPINNGLQPGNLDNFQINPSSLLKYCGISGLGSNLAANPTVTRRFNAVPYLAYFEIFKNYYANKQEQQAWMIHFSTTPQSLTMTSATMILQDGSTAGIPIVGPDTWVRRIIGPNSYLSISATGLPANVIGSQFFMRFNNASGIVRVPLTALFQSMTQTGTGKPMVGKARQADPIRE